MQKFVLSFLFSWALGLIFVPSTFAMSTATNDDSEGYRLPLYDQLDFSAEASDEGKVYMKWSTFAGHNNEEFEYYKVIRSYSNPNPLYPEDDAIAFFDGLGDLRYTDTNAWKSAYYRVCAITDIKGRYCSNVVWVEIQKDPAVSDCKNLSSDGRCEDGTVRPPIVGRPEPIRPPHPDDRCDNFAADGSCEDDEDRDEGEDGEDDDHWKDQRDEAREKWEKEQDAARERLDKRKTEWEEKEDARRQAEREKWATKDAEERDELKQKQAEKKEQFQDKKEAKKSDRETEILERLYKKLDVWLEKFHQRLEASDLTSTQKIEKIEAIQERFYTWEKENEMRRRMVDYIDKRLNEWKAKYANEDDFSDIDGFLDGLLD